MGMYKTFLLFWTACCTALAGSAQSPVSYEEEIAFWHQDRINSLKQEDGWLNLAGLFWLDEGVNTFGSALENRIIFPSPSFYSRAGSFERIGHTVILHAADGTDIRWKGERAGHTVVFSDSLKQQGYLSWGDLRWTIIRREDRIGIRLRDLRSPTLRDFKGIERFPADTSWRLKAIYLPASPAHSIMITNVLGQTTAQPSPGQLSFYYGGNNFTLDVLEDGNELFLVFGDQTNDNGTYPSGRFLYARKPVSGSEVVLDFNKSINPPCAFTPYATCPLPPRQNILPLLITAGEKYQHD